MTRLQPQVVEHGLIRDTEVHRIMRTTNVKPMDHLTMTTIMLSLEVVLEEVRSQQG